MPRAGTGLGRGARDPKPGGPAAPQQRAQPAPAHWRPLADEAGLSKGLGVQGAGVRPAGRARTPLRPLPLGEQVPDTRFGTSGAHGPAWEAGGAREKRVSIGAAPGLAWEGAASAAGQLASGWENPWRARAASEPANAAAAGARSAPKRALEAVPPAGVSVEGAPVRGVPGIGRASRPLYAHLSLDRLRGSDPGSRPGPDPEWPAAACGGHPGSLDACEPVAREVLGVRPLFARAAAEPLRSSGQAAQPHSAVGGHGDGAGGAGRGFGLGSRSAASHALNHEHVAAGGPGLALDGLRAQRLDPARGKAPVLVNPGVRVSAQSADAVVQREFAAARQAVGAGHMHTGPGRACAGAQSLSEIAGEPLEALLRL